MLDALLETWRTHEAINHLLLDGIPAAALEAVPLLKGGKPGKGRSVARVFGHIVDVRMSVMRKAEIAVAGGFKCFEKGAVPSRGEIDAALKASSAAVEARLAGAMESGVLTHKRGPWIWLGYIISHESHHRGQIMLALKQNAFVMPDSIKWGIWSRWFDS